MIKKLLLSLAICLIIAGCKTPAKAEVNLPDLIKKLPALNQSVIFSFDENKFDYATSITLVSLFDNKVNIDLGFSPRVEALGLISFKLIEFKNIIKFPILNQIVIEPFGYIGSRRIENLKEFGQYDYGVGAKIVSLKF